MLIKLKVHAGSKRPAILKKSEDAYEIWVRSPAEEGKANREALAILAKTTGQNVNRFRIIKGGQSPSKIVQLFGAPA